MRLLTHNTMRNNAADAKGKGFPLRITASQVRVEEVVQESSLEFEERQIAFVSGILPTLEWPALVQAATAMGVPTVPPNLTEDLIADKEFLKALYHVLMNVHLVAGVLTCPVTGREFPVINEIPNMILDESDAENVRY